MSKSKTPRKKKYDPAAAISRQVSAVLSDTMSKFYVMGDMSHDPMSFHTSRVNMHLKGAALAAGLKGMTNFLYGQRRLWQLAIFHFFIVDGKFEVVPAVIKFDDSLLNEVGDLTEECIQRTKEAVVQSEQGLRAEDHCFYGYYINHGEDLRLDLMEEDIIDILFKVNHDLQVIPAKVRECTAEKILRSIAGEKFSLINSGSLKTNMVEEKEDAAIY